MNITLLRKPSFRTALIAAGMAAGLSIGTVNAASDDNSMPQPHSDSVGATITDSTITADVKAKLIGKKSLKNSDISVTTTNGVVTLTGSAVNSDAKSAAEKIAKNVDGVKSVDNQLKVAGSSDAMAKTKRTMSDSWITTKVKSEILADSVTRGFKINVTTKHGVVILKGALANQDAIDHVKDIAGKVDGVKSVDTSALTVAAK